MIRRSIDEQAIKGWVAGPWNSDVPIPVGYATAGVDEPHRHDHMFEIYLVARGHARALVADHEVGLSCGDVLIVEPTEEHTFLWSSGDYLHFVIQAPHAPGDKTLIH